MNKDQISGQWHQMIGKAKEMWGDLTDDDVKKAEGSVDKLYGVIQEKFGETREAIAEKIKKMNLG